MKCPHTIFIIFNLNLYLFTKSCLKEKDNNKKKSKKYLNLFILNLKNKIKINMVNDNQFRHTNINHQSIKIIFVKMKYWEQKKLNKNKKRKFES